MNIPAQQIGHFVLLAANQGERFTGRVVMTFDFYAGSVKEINITGLERKIDLQRLNESANKTLFPTETMTR